MWQKRYSIAQLCLNAVHTIDTCIRIGLKVGSVSYVFSFFSATSIVLATPLQCRPFFYLRWLGSIPERCRNKQTYLAPISIVRQ
jgi:hypothetical protein